jgi:hypothetical protein
MKILIVSLPRTGSSELLYRLCNTHNLKNIYEPFDKTGLSEYIKGEDNIGLKSLIYDKIEGYKDNVEFYVELSKEFDQIILLTRRDLKKCAESWAYYRHIKDTTGESTMQPYKWKLTDNFEKCYINIIDWDNQLKLLSKKLNIGLTYYEDIFDVNSKERYRTNI